MVSMLIETRLAVKVWDSNVSRKEDTAVVASSKATLIIHNYRPKDTTSIP